VTSRRTTVALKLLMAVTGLLFAFFVLFHMYGNLKLLAGEDAYNTYAEHLRTMFEPILPHAGFLWILRVTLILALVVHVYAAVTLWMRAGNARRTPYAAGKAALRSTWIRWGGVFIFVFLIWHLIEFTISKVSVNPDKTGVAITQNPYQLVVASFQVWWLTLIYVLAMAALALHLEHGVFSAQQTLGWTQSVKGYRRAKIIGYGTAALVVGGFLIPPLMIQAGLVK
jgi:succinate dehydrogenase / fumarate reductase cytochrome b subunit